MGARTNRWTRAAGAHFVTNLVRRVLEFAPPRQLNRSVAFRTAGGSMNRKEFFRKWKVHLFFGGGLLLVLAISVVTNFLSGQTFLRATLGALREIRPVEYV